MSNYTKTTDFEAKDSLPTGDSGKIIRGAEFETEFDAISTAIATKADTAGPTFTGTLTFETISDGTIGVTAFVDEDDMSSDSATLVPTQQSVKAYVDSQVTAQDLDFQADTGGALSIDLDSESLTFTGGTGIDTSGSGNAVTFAIDSTVTTLTGSQTLTNKTLTAPVISTISNTGTITLPTSTDTLVGRATTDTLTNKTLTSAVLNTGVSGTAVLDEDDMSSNSATQLATQQSIKAYVDSQVATADALSEVLGNGNTTGGTDIAVGTGDDITFADSSKAIFGAGSDLQIYHDGSASYISDQGTGNLKLLAGNFRVRNSADTENIMQGNENGTVSLYYDNSVKFATTSTGIDVTGVITTDGMTTSADINFGDNDKAVFGAGSDLQIYHDGTHSNIKESGAGDLQIFGDNVNIYNSAGSQNLINLTSGGANTLFHNGSAKLATTSTGIDVTGTVTADGLTVDGQGKIQGTFALLDLVETDITDKNTRVITSGGQFRVDTVNDALSSSTKRIMVDHATGDISFYEDTGTTAKLFWDASAETLVVTGSDAGTAGIFVESSTSGVGARLDTIDATTSNSATLTNSLLLDSDNHAVIRMDSNNNGSGDFYITESSSDTARLRVANNGDVSLFEDTGTTAKLYWDASAESLGIGTSSPSRKLHVDASGVTALFGNTESNNSIELTRTTSSASYVSLAANSSTAGIIAGPTFTFSTANSGGGAVTERMRIESSGNVGIGTSSPSVALEVNGTIKASGNGKLQIADDTEGSTFEFNVGGGGALEIYDGSTERMRIDSSGNVGIGTSSPEETLSVMGDFQVALNTSVTGRGLKVSTSNTSITDDTVSINAQASTGILAFQTNSSERMRIDSSGNLLVGKTSITNSLGWSEVVQVGGANPAISLDNSSSVQWDISNYGGTFTIWNDANERMRIDSSGNLLVGTTDTDTQNNNAGSTADNGFVYNIGSGGYLNVARYGGTVAYFNRTSTDGAIVDFRKDGTTVGSIGTNSGNIYLSDGARGIAVDGDKVYPTYSTGGDADNAQDLGKTGARWRDLYLSGGAYLGGTGSANHLDDYEEGTFTPTVSSGVTSPTYSSQSGSYTKIGDLVYFQFRVDLNGGTANTFHFKFSGLPFTSVNRNDYGGAFISYSGGFIDDLGTVSLHITSNDTTVALYKPQNGNTVLGTDVETLGSILGVVFVNGVYRAA